MSGGERSSNFLSLWEEGVGDHPIDRAIGLIATIEGIPRATVAALTLDRRDRALFRIGEALFGGTVQVFATCEQCAAETELSFAIGDVLAIAPAADRIALPGGAAHCRMPDSRDLAAALGADDPRTALIAAVIDAPLADAATLAAAEAALADQAGVSDLSLAHRCATCDAEGVTPFDILDYLWRRIAAEGQRLLRDVHAIASAYGWSSETIIAMPPRRRAAHIALIGA